MSWAPVGLVGGLSLCGALSACGRRPPPPAPSRPVATASASIVAHDRLAPGEAPPGTEQAFELTLPRGARIDRKFGNEIYAIWNETPEEASTYIRERAPGSEPFVGPNGTIFPDLMLPTIPGGQHLRVTVRLADDGHSSLILVERWEDAPPPKVEPHDEVMRRSGMTPDGKLLDPKHME